MIETLAAMATGAVLGALVLNALRRRKPVEHQHCFHWMMTADVGRVVYQHCCHCGVVMATHVIGQWGEQPWRYSDHGTYITYKAEVDYRNKTA